MRLVPSVSQRICCGNTVTGHSCMGVSFFLSLPINQSIHRSIDPSIHRSFRAGADAPSAWGPIIRAAAISVNRTLVMTHITQVNITLTTGQEIAAPCGGAKCAGPRCMQVAGASETESGLGEIGRSRTSTDGLSMADSLCGREVARGNAQLTESLRACGGISNPFGSAGAT